MTGRGAFAGGADNDTINAKVTGSADTFYFNLGDGQDTFYLEDSKRVSDRIVFGKAITGDMLNYIKVGNDFIVTMLVIRWFLKTISLWFKIVKKST